MRTAKKYIDGTAHIKETSGGLYRPVLIPYITPPEMRAVLARAAEIKLTPSAAIRPR